MISRSRIFTTLLALLAFAGPAPLSASAFAPAGGVGACIDVMSEGCEQESHDSSTPASCPSMPASANTCSTAVFAVPDAPAADLLLDERGSQVARATIDAPVLLLVRGIFHPPRA